ncbi:Lrp/AsnC family transcriptional regulator [Streptomyces africanus]|uniref:Lrp/AsnC family transcriptional regulator n=1 Tax=Streptomyces africanus TaxID=231024 RepID=UPI003CC6D445
MESPSLDALDRKLLHALQVDGRAPFSRIAEVLGVSDQTIARRFRKLRTTAGLRVVGMTDERLLGRQAWIVRLRCTPDVAEQLAKALARRSDISPLLQAGPVPVISRQREQSSRVDRMPPPFYPRSMRSQPPFFVGRQNAGDGQAYERQGTAGA